MHEKHHREWAASGRKAQVPNHLEFSGLEGDLLDPARLGLPCAGRQEQYDDKEKEGQLASPESFDFASNKLSIHYHFPFVYQSMMINSRFQP